MKSDTIIILVLTEGESEREQNRQVTRSYRHPPLCVHVSPSLSQLQFVDNEQRLNLVTSNDIIFSNKRKSNGGYLSGR